MPDRASALPGYPRIVGLEAARTVAEMLVAFNEEFATPTPPARVLEARLARHLASGALLAMVSGEPPLAVAVLCPRPSVWFDGGCAVLDELYVAPEHRGRGIGTALLRAAEREMAARGVECIEINVDGDDTDARRFYERHGYQNHEHGETDPLLYYFRELSA